MMFHVYVYVCFFQLCVILEPMQELMSRHKTYNLSPRDCLKTCLFQKWQRMVAPPGNSKSLSAVLRDGDSPNGSNLCSDLILTDECV